MKKLRKLLRPETGRMACVTALTKFANAQNAPDSHVALLLVRPIHVEEMYTSLGYKGGVEVLSALQSVVKNALGKDDVVVHLDDGKLAIIVSALGHPNHALLAANMLRNVCERSLEVDGQQFVLRVRIGIAVLKMPQEKAESVLQGAEQALVEADDSGQSVVMRSESSTDCRLRDWEIEEGLRVALFEGDLELFFQPKIDIKAKTICGAEGLLRWETEGIRPDEFIPVAEKTGQITELTRFALQSAVRKIAEWPPEFGDLGVAINLSAMDLHRADLPAAIKGALDIWNVNPGRLTLEITETALMADPLAAHAVLTEIRSFGCRVSIDDFGTGYSSLQYFKSIPADELKIDKSFVSSMLTDAADLSIVKHVISLAHSFGLKVVAEGVEDRETLQCLSEMQCDYAQGFYFSRALRAGPFIRWAKKFTGDKFKAGSPASDV